MSENVRIRENVDQILVACGRIERRFQGIDCADDFLDSDEGVDRLDGITMMLIAIGENLKKLDKLTDGKLFAEYPEIDWKGAKGVRNVLSHHYFQIDAEIIFGICQSRIPPLEKAIREMLAGLE